MAEECFSIFSGLRLLINRLGWGERSGQVRCIGRVFCLCSTSLCLSATTSSEGSSKDAVVSRTRLAGLCVWCGVLYIHNGLDYPTMGSCSRPQVTGFFQDIDLDYPISCTVIGHHEVQDIDVKVT